MATVQIEVPEEILGLVGSEKEAQAEAKEAFLLNLVRKGKISRSKAAELLEISLWDLPELLARYEIPSDLSNLHWRGYFGCQIHHS